MDALARLNAGLFIGTELTIGGAIAIAHRHKLSEFFVGLVILSIGSDLPELAIAIDAGSKGLMGVDASGVVVGTSIGSVVTQISFVLGLAGVIVGVIAGILVTQRLGWVQQQVESLTGVDVLPASVYQGVSTVPTSVDPVEVAAVAAIAMVLSLGATLLPSRQGASLDPAEALRYE